MPNRSFKIARLVAISFTLMVLSVLGTAAAIPGPQRALAPGLFGLTQIDQSTFIDATTKADEAKSLIIKANSTLKAFFGELKSSPKIVICTQESCFDRFGGGPRGITYGYDLIKIGPKGFNEMIITHELFHGELHKRMGRFGMVKPKFPAWFNEGLATIISNDNRYRTKFTPDELAWIRNANNYWGDWGNRISERGWRDTYGAARAAVLALQNEIGQKGLLQLIDLVTIDDLEFEAAITKVRTQTLSTSQS
ncbi:MAG: hypothetical protein WBD01_15500 [Salaquimonas sp.]